MTSTHNEENTGKYGAKRQSWRHANPRDILKRHIAENPEDTAEEIRQSFWDRLQRPDAEEYRRAVFDYWFDNNYRSLVEQRASSDPATLAARQVAETQKAAVVERVATQARETIRARVEEKAVAILLDMQLPNGKLLRDCTFKYVHTLGGGLSRVGGAGKPNQIIGKVLKEDQVRKLYNGG